jgi:hypothetical protein
MEKVALILSLCLVYRLQLSTTNVACLDMACTIVMQRDTSSRAKVSSINRRQLNLARSTATTAFQLSSLFPALLFTSRCASLAVLLLLLIQFWPRRILHCIGLCRTGIHRTTDSSFARQRRDVLTLGKKLFASRHNLSGERLRLSVC